MSRFVRFVRSPFVPWIRLFVHFFLSHDMSQEDPLVSSGVSDSNGDDDVKVYESKKMSSPFLVGGTVFLLVVTLLAVGLFFLFWDFGGDEVQWKFVGADESIITLDGSQEDDLKTCIHVVVGSGYGGVYAAWRLVDAGVWNASDICFFEAEGRVGGRSLTLTNLGEGPLQDLKIDLCAHRFIPIGETSQFFFLSMFNEYNFSSVCYEGQGRCDEGDIPGLSLVVDEFANNSGFIAILMNMLRDLREAGMRKVYGLHQLVGTENQGRVLQFAFLDKQKKKIQDIELTPTGDIWLNLPPSVFPELEGDFASLNATDPLSQALSSPFEVAMVKQYVVYEDAYWISLLDDCLTSFRNRTLEPPLNGHYPDGDAIVSCSSSSSSSLTMEEDQVNYCRGTYECSPIIETALGTLLSYYSTPTSYFIEALEGIDDAIIVGTQEENSHLLEEIHFSLMTDNGLNPDSIPLPVLTAISIMNGTRYPGIPGLEYMLEDVHHTKVNTIMSPFSPPNNVYIVNAAYLMIDDGAWAEDSFLMGERILRKYYGLGPREEANIPADYYNENVCADLGVVDCDL